MNILVPAETLLGLSATPGEAAGYGLLDAQDARDLVAAAARHPNTRWCITAVHPDGTAAAHGCARGRHPPPGTPAGPDPPPPGTATGPDPPPGTAVRDYLASLRIQMAPIARGHCDHTRAETGYQPSRALQHLIKVRNARCTAPGCGQPASRCDLDHTVAWDQGGLTCECDLAPLCRTIIGVSRARAGNSNNRAQASCDGGPQPDAGTPLRRPPTRSDPGSLGPRGSSLAEPEPALETCASLTAPTPLTAQPRRACPTQPRRASSLLLPPPSSRLPASLPLLLLLPASSSLLPPPSSPPPSSLLLPPPSLLPPAHRPTAPDRPCTYIEHLTGAEDPI